MNWYKQAATPLYDYVSQHEVPDFQPQSETLPDGYYFMQENGRWSVFAPNGERVAVNEPTKDGARKRALQLIRYIKAKALKETIVS